MHCLVPRQAYRVHNAGAAVLRKERAGRKTRRLGNPLPRSFVPLFDENVKDDIIDGRFKPGMSIVQAQVNAHSRRGLMTSLWTSRCQLFPSQYADFDFAMLPSLVSRTDSTISNLLLCREGTLCASSLSDF